MRNKPGSLWNKAIQISKKRGHHKPHYLRHQVLFSLKESTWTEGATKGLKMWKEVELVIFKGKGTHNLIHFEDWTHHATEDKKTVTEQQLKKTGDKKIYMHQSRPERDKGRFRSLFAVKRFMVKFAARLYKKWKAMRTETESIDTSRFPAVFRSHGHCFIKIVY